MRSWQRISKHFYVVSLLSSRQHHYSLVDEYLSTTPSLTSVYLMSLHMMTIFTYVLRGDQNYRGSESLGTRLEEDTYQFPGYLTTYLLMHPSLAKERHGWSTLQILSKRRVDALSNVSTFNVKECPCHVYSDSMPSMYIIGQTVTYNETTSSFEVKS